MSEYRHIVFNPMHLMSLKDVCETCEKEGFGLVRVLHWQHYEAIAVFERPSAIHHGNPDISD